MNILALLYVTNRYLINDLQIGSPRAKSFDCVQKIAKMAGLPTLTGRVNTSVITNTSPNIKDLAIRMPAINLQFIALRSNMAIFCNSKAGSAIFPTITPTAPALCWVINLSFPSIYPRMTTANILPIAGNKLLIDPSPIIVRSGGITM